MKYYKSDQHKIEFAFSENSLIAYEKHNHVSVYAVGLILDGSIHLERQGKKYECAVDDLFIIPPYMVHSITPCAKTYSIITLCIRTAFLNDCKLIQGKAILTDLADRLICDGILSAAQTEAFTDALEIVYNLYGNEDFSHDDMISETKAFIESQPETNITLDSLSEKIFVSKYYLVRKFKKNIGLSPHRFQIQNRIRKSQHLLQNGAGLTETALAMGFYDQSHFIKYFKKIVGITPSEYIDSLESLK
ncbi:helix-turn-helix domain-containing protein [Acetobacterium paludosum]|uniref:Helix-turn-helix domain-containing protein n=1 Tax=Acetobacterium paludosum TaxID=52693 RepID=A0A923HVL8_9FIRM|nr:helix-turn-helix transcriptional regulator [Acetobacterium paludosum]MBC3886736.1 helix-turn-helix domain-containing protein [Acetobacterium paludosum]